MKYFPKYKCEYCGRMVSNSGLGHASHMRYHARVGDVVEEDGTCGKYWYPTEQGEYKALSIRREAEEAK